MSIIAEESVRGVIDATDIVALVESYLPLKRSGSVYKALCPFHHERTPSFQVNPAMQIFKCFGCGAGGDAIAFVRAYEHLEFVEAVRRLAQRAGIVIEEQELDNESRKRLAQRDLILHVQNEAAKWFHDFLCRDQSEETEKARAYLKGRKIDSGIAKRWQIGYAPFDGRRFLSWAREREFKGRTLVNAGLAGVKDEENPQRGLYSSFYGRIMFPIRNDQNEVIAFSGRILDPEAKVAKYKNSPETAVFKKNRTFFGFEKSKRAIVKAKCAIIVEGQVDLITCFENGIENVVAPLGTAFTEEHAAILKRYVDEILLCFDSDSAGLKAADRAHATLARAGFAVRCAEIPPGEDPDSLIRSGQLGEFQRIIAEAQPYHDFKIALARKQSNLQDPAERLRLVNEMVDSIAVMKDPFAQKTVLENVAAQLKVSSSDLSARVKSVSRRQGAHRGDAGPTAEPTREFHIEDRGIAGLCRLILINAEVKEWLKSQGDTRSWLQELPESDLLINLWDGNFDPDQISSVQSFLRTLSPEVQRFCSELFHARYPGKTLEDGKRAIANLGIRRLELRLGELAGKLNDPKLEPQEVLDLTSRIQTLRREILDRKGRMADVA